MGAMNMNKVTTIIFGVIGAVILFISIFFIVAGVAPDLILAANNITASGLPLASLFSSSGVLFILFMIVLFVALIVAMFKMMLGGGGK